MGVGLSKELTSISPRSQVIGASNFDDVSSGELYKERFYTYLQSFQIEDLVPEVQTDYSRDDLISVLTYCHDHVSNLPKLLEAVICQNDNNDLPFLAGLQSEFKTYIKNAEMRKSFYEGNRLITTKFNFENSLRLKHSKHTKPQTFDDILNAFSVAVKKFKSPNDFKDSFVNTVTYFSNVVPTDSLELPRKSNFIKSSSNYSIINSPRVLPRGITSNGIFLFVPTGARSIFIYPLNNSCALTTPLIRNIKEKFSKSSYAYASLTDLYVVSDKVIYQYNIKQLVMNDRDEITIVPKMAGSSKDTVIKTSDGISKFKVSKKGVFINSLINDEEHENDDTYIEAKASRHMDDRCKTVVPDPVKFDFTCFTNGAFIGFLIKINHDQLLYRVFSAITGDFVKDELILDEDIMGLCFDAVNSCYFVISSVDDAQTIVKSIPATSTVDYRLFKYQIYSKKIFEKSHLANFAESASKLLFHYTDSSSVPSQLVSDDHHKLSDMLDVLKAYLNLSQDIIQQYPKLYTSLLEALCVLFNINLNHHLVGRAYRQNVCDEISNILRGIPINLSCLLFFSNLNYLMMELNDMNITIMTEIFVNLKDQYQIKYALTKLERSNVLQRIPFHTINGFSKYLFQQSSSMNKSVRNMYYLHQRVLINEVYTLLSKNPFLEIEFRSQKRGDLMQQNPLDIFADYFQSIITKIDSVISASNSGHDLLKDPCIHIFANMIRIMSCLVSFHSIARFASALLSVILTKLYEYINAKAIKIEDSSSMQEFILLILYTYSSFASTLVMGGGLSDFESQAMWLIRGNINLVDNSELSARLAKISYQDIQENVVDFIREGNISDYYKYKPMMNKKLTDDIMKLDRVVLAALAKHTGMLEELLDHSETTANMKKLLEQMLRIRNHFRSFLQNDNEQEAKNVFIRALMLLKMDSKFADDEVPLTQVSNFITSNNEPELIPKIISCQRMRIQTTLVGFALIERTYTMNTHPLLGQVIAFCMSKINNFDGLAVIARITTLSQQQMKQVNSFFEMMRNQLALTNNKHFAQVCFKFFRDMETFEETRDNFFINGINDFHKTKYDPLYALIYFLALKYNKFPQNIDINNSDLKDTALLAEIIRNALKNEEVLDILVDRYFKSKDYLMTRVLGRCILEILPEFPQKLPKFIERSVIFIGSCEAGLVDRDIASEMMAVSRSLFDFEAGKEEFNKYISSIRVDNLNQIVHAGVFAILGDVVEPMRPFCNSKYIWRGMATEYITTLIDEGQTYFCIPHPFILEDQPRSIKNKPSNTMITMPLIEMNRKKFLEYDWFFKCFDIFDEYQPTVKVIYSYALSNFCRDKEFVELLKPKHIERLTRNMQPYFNIRQTFNQISSLQMIPRERRSNMFSCLKFRNSDMDSFLSPILDDKADSINVSLSVPSSYFAGYIGITSSPLDRFQTKWSMVGVPIGRVYPEDRFLMQLPRAKVFTFTVFPSERTYQVGDKKIPFPPGDCFRIVVGCRNDLKLRIYCDDKFDYERTNSFTCHAVVCQNCDQIYKVPEWTQRFTNNYEVPSDLNVLPDSDYEIRQVPREEKEKLSLLRPPKNILIHLGFATSASDYLIEDELRSVMCLLCEKMNTLAAARIAAVDSSMIPMEYLVKLFSILVCQTEYFSIEDFVVGQYPFDLYTPVWNQDLHTAMEQEFESKLSMKSIIKLPSFLRALSDTLFKMVNDPSINLASKNQTFSNYFTATNRTNKISIHHKFSIVTDTSFCGFIPQFFKCNKKFLDSPLICAKENIELELTDVAQGSDVLVFGISHLSPEWIFASPYETILLLKNFAYMCTSIADQTLARGFALDLFNMRSPLIQFFVPSLIQHLQILIPPTPMYKDRNYLGKLLTFGSIIKRQDDDRLFQVYNSERRIYSSKNALEAAPFFPEFFGTKIPAPQKETLEINILPINPGAFKQDLREYVQILKLFSHKYTSIIGFPFWEILPLWYRLSGLAVVNNDLIPPTYELTNEGYYKLTNPSELEMRIKITPRIAINPETMIAVSNNQFFDDPIYIQGKKIRDIITTPKQELYLSVATKGLGWHHFKFELYWDLPYDNEDQRIDITPATIHDRFIEDMQNFAVNWTPTDTQDLLSILPKSTLCLPTFATTESIAKTSELSQKYGETVVALKALLIHHFNYIRTMCKEKVPSNLLHGLSSLITSEDAANEVLQNIITNNKTSVPSFEINRKIARQLMMNGGGLPRTVSVIHQLSQVISRSKPSYFQNSTRPWKVAFVGEAAIDAGGPAHELMTETAESIFDPTSDICFPCGQYFVPVMSSKDQMIEFKTIGVFLGIIIRVRLPQTLPFAPFVYDFISGKSVITNDDIIETDKNVKAMIENIRNNRSDPDFEKICPVNWTYTTWSGKKKLMNGHSAHELVSADGSEQYIMEFLRLRMGEILPGLQLIREGFIENTGIESHNLLTGSLLSHMCQGSPIITSQQIMQSLSVSNGYESFSDPPIRYFLEALERMNAEQRRKLLRFVTTFTRLPSNNKFRFRIDLLARDDPDGSLPTASTCFNKLHLPAYTSADICYERLAVAIQYCGTMENK